MQRRRRAVVADIADQLAFRRQRIEALAVGRLVDEAALGQHAQEIGFEGGHDHFPRKAAGNGKRRTRAFSIPSSRNHKDDDHA